MADNPIYCSNCGTANTGSGGFCQKCGSRLLASPAAIPTPMAVSPSPGAVTAYAPASAFAMQEYGGFWIRFVAFLVDRIILGAVAAPFFVVLVLPSILRAIREGRLHNEPPPEMVVSIVSAALTYAAIVFIGQWLYEAFLTSSSWQGTIGKKLLHLIVTDEQGNRISFARATGRYFAKIISSLILNIGFIMVAFTERKQGLHDMIAGTLVKRS